LFQTECIIVRRENERREKRKKDREVERERERGRLMKEKLFQHLVVVTPQMLCFVLRVIFDPFHAPH
jgi:hypothetical protein